MPSNALSSARQRGRRARAHTTRRHLGACRHVVGPRERPKEGTTPAVERPTSAAGSHPQPRLFGAGLPPRTRCQRYATARSAGRDFAQPCPTRFPLGDHHEFFFRRFMHTSDSSGGTDAWVKSRRCQNLSASLERQLRPIRGQASDLALRILGESVDSTHRYPNRSCDGQDGAGSTVVAGERTAA